jgi:hypothetical protein
MNEWPERDPFPGPLPIEPGGYIDSDLFHETDRIVFKKDFLNRRITAGLTSRYSTLCRRERATYSVKC